MWKFVIISLHISSVKLCWQSVWRIAIFFKKTDDRFHRTTAISVPEYVSANLRSTIVRVMGNVANYAVLWITKPGRSQVFVSEGSRGQKSGSRHQRGPYRHGAPVGSGAKSPKHEKYAENLIECHKFYTVQTKKFISVAISEGDMSPLSPSLRPSMKRLVGLIFDWISRSYTWSYYMIYMVIRRSTVAYKTYRSCSSSINCKLSIVCAISWDVTSLGKVTPGRARKDIDWKQNRGHVYVCSAAHGCRVAQKNLWTACYLNWLTTSW